MNLVTDRTQADVLLGTEKGRYGIADLNRVEQAVAELCTLVKQLDLYPKLETKTDWSLPGVFSAGGWPTTGQMERYLCNVRTLCDTVELAVQLPSSMERLTWEGANEIEQALFGVYTRVQGILQTFRFSGELFAGEESIQ